MKGNEKKKARQLKTTFNYALSIFWTIIYLSPVLYFSYHYINPAWIYGILAAASIVYFIPGRMLEKIQAGNKISFYHKAGIRLVRRVTQDGDFVNNLVRNKVPGHKPQRKNYKSLLRKFIFLEKFHYHFLLYFLFAMIYALVIRQYIWAAVILICNLLFNVYPIMLQQYNRLRIRNRKSVESNSVMQN